jgi:hypothetical protein
MSSALGGSLLSLVLWLILGAGLVLPAFEDLVGWVLLYAARSLTLVRMVRSPRHAIAVTIVLSVAAHGVTARPLVARYVASLATRPMSRRRCNHLSGGEARRACSGVNSVNGTCEEAPHDEQP